MVTGNIREILKNWWKSRSDLIHGLIIALLIVAGLFFIINLLFFSVSFFPSSCNACHIMKPYYENWKTSVHNKAGCIECHPFRPGFITTAILKYFTGTYNPRPHAIVDDSSCLKSGCHNERIKNGKTTFKGSIIFDHEVHISKTKRGEKLRCATCHSQIVQGEHISVTEKVCFLCHFKGAAKGQSITGCPSCHGVPKKVVEHEGFSFSHESYLKIGVGCNQCHIEVASGDGNVPEEKCHFCHIPRKKSNLDLITLHKIHVTEKEIYCFNCHEEIKHGGIKLVQPFEVRCESCHEKKHSPQKELYMGVSGKGVADTPSRMFAAQVSCDGCHTDSHDRKERYKSIKNACVNCHGKKYDLMLDDWKREINLSLDYLSNLINDAESLLKSNLLKKEKYEGAKELLEDAIFNYNLVKNGRGEHNVEYAIKLLSSSIDQYEIAKKSLNPGFSPTRRPEVLREPDGYCTKLCHNRLGLPEKKFFDEMHIEFPHRLHSEEMELGCATCHSPEKHKMRIITKEGCMNCHHKGENLNCRQCHPFQTELYTGKFRGKKISADVMFSAGVTCIDCHNLKEKAHTVETIKVKCIECHEKGYDELLIQWEKDLLEAESSATLKVSGLREKIESSKLLGKQVPKNSEDLLERAELIIKATGEGRGIHNYEESIKLLQETEKEIDEMLKK
jgi:nitrate/TMAO reductase-like tetraheme cytochrome c subunit